MDPEPDGAPFGGGGISGDLSDLVSDAATLLAEHLWHPVRKRRIVKRLLDDNRKAEAALRAKPVDRDEPLDWSPSRF